ncbi:hypothetical protein D0869_05896 [Hortaea werneckii]|uniref:18S rRNA factor 2 n=1 Tax=Hortaea werneckii TaxID=91943 RepID=A0A3M6WW30_HORWE|nr:hypothetical protein KC324_g1640 [Hortaea werneckii]RMX82649.1 hypothetical protein D0869_05896 [Hortaea werneckii]
MSTRKRNEFLDADESEDEQGGYNSDEVEEGRGAIGGRANKRQRTEDVDSDDASFHSLEDDEEQQEKGEKQTSKKNFSSVGADRFQLGSDFDDDDEQKAPQAEEDEEQSTTPKLSKFKTPKSVAASEKAARKSGVVYISRVPPFMKPQTLRHYLAPHALKGLGRIFLTPEDHEQHTQRVKRGGNKKKSFTDGWVEFASKTEAKLAAETLNGNIIGGKKGNFYHDDLWNMKYLKGFKWSHLTEQIANENAERAARLREEVRRTRQENKAFVEDVERGKMLEGMESKKKAKRRAAGDGESAADVGEQKKARDFKQRKVQGKEDRKGQAEQSAELKNVLGKIF